MREVLGSILPVLSVLAVLIGAVLGGAPAARANDELDFGLAQNTLARILIEGNATFPDDELKSVLQIREPSWLHPFSTPRYRPDLLDTQLRLLVRY